MANGTTTPEMLGKLYDYHWWANRNLLDVAIALGEEPSARDVGAQFSFPTVRRMFAHIYGADWLWLRRFQGESPTALAGGDIGTLGELRKRWDELEREQRSFVGSLGASDLGREVVYRTTEGTTYRMALWPLLYHVLNHATHHRSEIATAPGAAGRWVQGGGLSYSPG